MLADSQSDRSRIAGWIAVVISVVILCFWAFWGSVENFYEGWYFRSIWQNLGLMLIQYASPMLILMIPSVAAVKWPELSLLFFVPLAILAWIVFHFRLVAGSVVIIVIVPLLLFMGVLYRVGRPEPRRWAYRALVGLPLTTFVVCGAVPGWRAVGRIDDGNYGARRIVGNGVTLTWAPEGPGWPETSATWFEARTRCRNLSADGKLLMGAAQDIWRLPTVEEAVRSMVHRGENAGGEWDPLTHSAKYRTWPDKDSPLWKAHSQIIYWWTATEADAGRSYYVVYNGQVNVASKNANEGNLAYRCVSEGSH